MKSPTVSVVVPTIGRPDSLRQLLDSLTRQTALPVEVIVADGSDSDATGEMLNARSDDRFNVRRIKVHPPNAVTQRHSAIRIANGSHLLLLDDDVVLERECIEQMLRVMVDHPTAVAVVADFTNQMWPRPTRVWKWYLRTFYGVAGTAWQGRVLGPLLRYGYAEPQVGPMPMQWVGAGNTLVARHAFDAVGGFSNFFLHRCTMNEDVDLGLKLGRVGQLLFCPTALMAHHHAPSGRVPPEVAAEDDIHNRFMILHHTSGQSQFSAAMLVGLYIFVESLSNLLGGLRRGNFHSALILLKGRLRGLSTVFRYLLNRPG